MVSKMEKQDYYSVGSKEDIVVSSSILKYIDPEQGGNPVDFLNSFEESTEETPAMRRGSIIHLWHEDRNKFQIAEVVKPSEKLGQIADKVIELIKLGGHGSDEDYEQAIREVEYYKNRWEKGMAKLIQDVKTSCDNYVYEFLSAKENDLIFMTAQDAEIVINACQAIENHPVARDLLFHQDNGIDRIEILTEQEVFWKELVSLEEDFTGLNFKAKIDKIVINHETKTITIIDLKTTGKGVYSYGGTNFETYKTYRQLAFYNLAVRRHLKKQDPQIYSTEHGWKFKHKIIAVGTTDSQQCVVYDVPMDWILKGIKEIRELSKRIVTHKRFNQWSYTIEEYDNSLELTIPYKV